MKRIDLASIPPKVEVDYQDNAIALVSDIKKVRELQSDTFLLDTYLAVIVLNGSGTLYVGDEEFRVEKGDVFVSKPANILEKSMLSMDLEIRGIIVSKEMVEMLMKEVHLNLNWAVHVMTASHDVVRVDEAEMRRLCMYYDLLNDKLNAPNSNRKSVSLKALLVAFVNEFIEVMEENDHIMLRPTNYSSAEYIFERFIHLLEDPHQPFVSVNEYASLLHLTPKYFSSVCKKLSGKTAKEIIQEETIKQAKLLLRDNSLSIKEVADRLNFTNQSHFGTYFHRHTGLSPQQFRGEK
ncbi:MAG: helix-turn-helix domain-containing protein [Bacteroidaceae bacterium]|nr:helix-turn-helix domain-containing protein [Bacteroidaceae bacterium]